MLSLIHILCDKSKSRTYVNIDSPAPTLFTAVAPAKKGEEEKMGTGLARLREEDPSFVIRQDTETKQTLLGTQGEMQLNIIISKLKERFNVDVVTSPRKIAYRETIKGPVSYTHLTLQNVPHISERTILNM